MRSTSCLLVFYFIVGIFAASGKPDRYTEYDIALRACTTFIGKSATVCISQGKRNIPYKCYCGTSAGFGTLVDCFVKGYDNSTGIINEFIETCSNQANITMTEEEFWKKYFISTSEMKNVSLIENSKPHSKAEKAPSNERGGRSTPEPVKFPVLIDYSKFPPYRKAYRMNMNNFNLAMDFGSGLLGYWAGVLVVAGIVNWTIRLFPGLVEYFTGRFSNSYRRYITLSALVKKKKTNEQKILGIFDCLVPSRMESIIISGFVLLTGFFSGFHIHHIENNPIYPTLASELGHMIADRTGVVVCFIIPLLILFAGRNNFLQWLTRWNFATFITFHRWVSRVSVWLVIVHSITFTISDISTGRYTRRMQSTFMKWGTVATISGGIILVQASLYFRRRWYETFLILHIIFAALFIAGAWYHTERFGYGNFYYACAGIWSFDRAVRLGRLVSFGMPSATVTLLADETLRVVVPKPKYWKSIPGGHAFIHFMRPSCFWQSHPFTFTESPDADGAIVFYVKVKGGVTHGLYQHLSNFPGKTSTIRVCVEGPYGEPSSARSYKNVHFVAGGNGIPGIYSECFDLARSSSQQSIKLTWVIREWKSLSWFYDELKQLKDTKIQATVYVTRPKSSTGVEYLENINSESTSSQFEKSESSDEKCKELDSTEDTSSVNDIVESLKGELAHINFEEGRPDIESLIIEEIKETNGSLAYVTCGSPLMVDDIRYAIVSNLDATKYRVEYFEQLQTWT